MEELRRVPCSCSALIEPLFDTFDEICFYPHLSSIHLRDYAIVTESFANLGGTDFSQFLKQGITNSIAYTKHVSNVDFTLAKLLKEIQIQ